MMKQSKPKRHQAANTRAPKNHTPNARESKRRALYEPNGETNGHREQLIAVPHVGPGRRRMVPAESLDGLAVRLAHEMAAETVNRIRAIVDRMVKRAIEDAIGKI
jgi:hypothetical protein